MVSILRGGTRTPSCCPHLHAVHHGAGLRYRLPVQPHSFNMKLNGVRNQSAGVFQRRASSDTSRKVRDIRGPVVGRLFKHDGVYHFSPALFKIELNVPTGMSSPSWPGTVMVPGFVG